MARVSAAPVAADVTVTKRPAVVELSVCSRLATHIAAVAVTVPDVAVNEIAPVPVASTLISGVPVE